METQMNENTGEAQTATPVQTAGKTLQKDAVYAFVSDALKGIQVPEGVKVRELVTKDVRKVVRTRLFNAIRNGEVKLGKSYDDSKLKKYCSGLINNWLKKDPRFN